MIIVLAVANLAVMIAIAVLFVTAVLIREGILFPAQGCHCRRDDIERGTRDTLADLRAIVTCAVIAARHMLRARMLRTPGAGLDGLIVTGRKLSRRDVARIRKRWAAAQKMPWVYSIAPEPPHPDPEDGTEQSRGEHPYPDVTAPQAVIDALPVVPRYYQRHEQEAGWMA